MAISGRATWSLGTGQRSLAKGQEGAEIHWAPFAKSCSLAPAEFTWRKGRLSLSSSFIEI